jgi:hypothetical protein
MPRPKVILQLYPMIPAESREDRERKRPTGRNRELYHRVLHEWMAVALPRAWQVPPGRVRFASEL